MSDEFDKLIAAQQRKNIATALISLFIAFCIGWLVGYYATNDSWEQDAVESGYAEYYVDVDHKKQWRWLRQEREGE